MADTFYSSNTAYLAAQELHKILSELIGCLPAMTAIHQTEMRTSDLGTANISAWIQITFISTKTFSAYVRWATHDPLTGAVLDVPLCNLRVKKAGEDWVTYPLDPNFTGYTREATDALYALREEQSKERAVRAAAMKKAEEVTVGEPVTGH